MRRKHNIARKDPGFTKYAKGYGTSSVVLSKWTRASHQITTYAEYIGPIKENSQYYGKKQQYIWSL